MTPRFRRAMTLLVLLMVVVMVIFSALSGAMF